METLCQGSCPGPGTAPRRAMTWRSRRTTRVLLTTASKPLQALLCATALQTSFLLHGKARRPPVEAPDRALGTMRMRRHLRVAPSQRHLPRRSGGGGGPGNSVVRPHANDASAPSPYTNVRMLQVCITCSIMCALTVHNNIPGHSAQPPP